MALFSPLQCFYATIVEGAARSLYRIIFSFLFLAPDARTTRYKEAYFPLENQGKKGSLRSRASLILLISIVTYTE